MWNDVVCRHFSVDWLGSHRCCCRDCGKFGHWFEQGYVIWTRASRRPEDDLQAQTETATAATKKAG